MNYFEEHEGGLKDVGDTFALFADTMGQFVIPEIALPELERIRGLSPADPSQFVEKVRHALFESESLEEIGEADTLVSTFKERLGALAKERAIVLVLGNNGAKESQAANEGRDPLEYRVMNILNFCASKLSALLTYKLFVVAVVTQNK